MDTASRSRLDGENMDTTVVAIYFTGKMLLSVDHDEDAQKEDIEWKAICEFNGLMEEDGIENVKIQDVDAIGK